MKNIRFLYYSILTLVHILLIQNCSLQTRNKYFQKADSFFHKGDFKQTIVEIQTNIKKKYNPKLDRLLSNLDIGILYYYNQQPNESLAYLHEADHLAEELAIKSVSQQVGSYIVNDRVTDYSGEDFEHVYINVFKTLNHIKKEDIEKAFIEIRKAQNKIRYLEDKYIKIARQYTKEKHQIKGFQQVTSTQFSSSAFIHYLSLLMYRSLNDTGNMNVARKKVLQAFTSQKKIYNFPSPTLEKEVSRSTSPRINFFILTGLSPIKKAETFYVVTGVAGSFFIAELKENKHGKQELQKILPLFINLPNMPEGYHFKYQVPYLSKRSNKIKKVKVYLNNKFTQELSLIEKVDNIAINTFNMRKSLILLKTITRATVKGVSSIVAAEIARQNAPQSDGANFLIGGLIQAVGQIYTEVSEVADLRISRYMPANIYVGEIHTTQDIHTIRLEFINAEGAILAHETEKVDTRNKNQIFISDYKPF